MDGNIRSIANTAEPYQDLANAIIYTAANDYRVALKCNNKKLRVEVESFFYSNWYALLTNVEPDRILDRLRQEFS